MAAASRALVAFSSALAFFAHPALAAPPDPAPETNPGSAVVARLHEALSAVLERSDELGFEGRYEALAGAIGESYDLPLMARRAVGRHFRKLDEQQQGQLIDAFTRLTIATYADRLREGSGSRFAIHSEEPGDHGTLLVKAAAIAADGEETPLTYRLRRVDDRYLIIDVFLNGTISELALRRSEYTSVIDREGFPGLMEVLEDKISAHRSGIPADSTS